ncbi:MAG TPA: Rieske 2Fe-2S domain-containing protein [Gemmatimonadales bacterium]|nr:Rieske 2Fe-2S domain-containing protein [Gemmatimonadales bacterium]
MVLTKEENDLVTRTGPGTPCGKLLRSYWQPAALSEELPEGGPPIPLRLFGEDLVLFRDEQGRVGLLDLHCSHRGTDLSYGRLEDGGLRCVYHGWLYDVHGKCLETPAEPPGSRLRDYVRHTAYPCQEVGGVIFTYMGEGEPPLLPNYEVFAVPASHRLATKHFHECNWLQGLEGSQDATHVRFLHRFLRTEQGERALATHPKALKPGEDASFRDPPKNEYYGPVRTEEHDFSVWVWYPNGRGGPEYTFPSLCLTNGGPQASGDGYQIYWRVPIDDEHCWLFSLAFKRSGPIPPEHVYQRSWAMMTPDYHFIRNQRNRYLQDREEQKTTTFTGMGNVFVVQDALANETQPAIQDRTKELLGNADMAIAAWRRMLIRAIRDVEAGGTPPGQIRDPRVNEVDPIFLRRNAPPTDDELAEVLEITGGNWVSSMSRGHRPSQGAAQVRELPPTAGVTTGD